MSLPFISEIQKVYGNVDLDFIETLRHRRGKLRIGIAFMTDSYKLGHHLMLPEGTWLQYGNLTPRSDKRAPRGVDFYMYLGGQPLVRWLIEKLREDFFDRPENEVISEIEEELSLHYGSDYDASHFRALHRLGYLPMKFKGLPEGSKVPFGVPALTFHNTHKDFPWLSLLFETTLSYMFWKMPTNATIAYLYKKILLKGALKTDKDNLEFVNFQGHDFSARGLSGEDATWLSGLGHAAFFWGSDTLSVIPAIRHYYEDKGFLIASVFASEHSVSSACIGVMGELEMVKYYMKQYPKGILSVVSDTLDLTKMVKPVEGGYIHDLKPLIIDRDGKIVVRPDSSPPKRTPVDMVCGHNEPLTERELEADYPEFYHKGVVECLYDTYGGTINEQGYKVLDPHVGAIYGEAINLERAEEMCNRLAAKGFATTNNVLGIGSFTYQYNTRDTLQIAAKGTYVIVNGEGIAIYKDPVTDGGFKKSAKGLMRVDLVDGKFVMKDNCTWEEEAGGELMTIAEDEILFNQTSFATIRERFQEIVLADAKAELEMEMA